MKKRPYRANQPAESESPERCKVCTKRIRPGEDHARVFYSGSYYTVCCASCAAKFEANPHSYLVA